MAVVIGAGPIGTLVAMVAGGVDTGWTFYTPYSSTYANTHVMATALGIFISGFSSILTGLNFIVTIHKMRAPGLTWFRMPLFVWAHYATSIIQILGTPVVGITGAPIALLITMPETPVVMAEETAVGTRLCQRARLQTMNQLVAGNASPNKYMQRSGDA